MEMSAVMLERFVGMAFCFVCRWRDSRDAGTWEFADRLARESLAKHEAQEGHRDQRSEVGAYKAEPVN